jgi:hypothetical protein
MNKQITLSAITDELGQAVTHKKEFFQQIVRSNADTLGV